MNVTEILAEVARSGVKLNIHGEDLALSFTGARPEGLISAIRANKQGIIEALRRENTQSSEKCEQSEERSKRDLNLPPLELALPATFPSMEVAEQTRLMNLVLQQGKPAVGWCLRRRDAYYERFPQFTLYELDAAAAGDLLNWQALRKAANSTAEATATG